MIFVWLTCFVLFLNTTKSFAETQRNLSLSTGSWFWFSLRRFEGEFLTLTWLNPIRCYETSFCQDINAAVCFRNNDVFYWWKYKSAFRDIKGNPRHPYDWTGLDKWAGIFWLNISRKKEWCLSSVCVSVCVYTLIDKMSHHPLGFITLITSAWLCRWLGEIPRSSFPGTQYVCVSLCMSVFIYWKGLLFVHIGMTVRYKTGTLY